MAYNEDKLRKNQNSFEQRVKEMDDVFCLLIKEKEKITHRKR